MKRVPCEVYTRVVGYFRPVQNWNEGKREEYFDRVTFSESVSLSSKAFDTEKETVQTAEAEEAQMELVESDRPGRYEIFTLPNCDKCRQIKETLLAKQIDGEEFNLKEKDGLARVRKIYREYKDRIKRNDDGSMSVPLVLLYDDQNQLKQVAQEASDIEKIA
jgi:ribonucleoside-triphosphate reductase